MKFETMKVKDVLRIRGKLTNHVGIEIEVEGSNLPEIDTEVWKSERDQSLRGESWEYVLRTPVPFNMTDSVLAQMQEEWKTHNAVIKNSPNAGVHVHINASDLTVTQLFNFISLYLVVENVLVNTCGVDRVGNLFCLRASDAEYLIDVIQDAVRENDLSLFHTDDLRYASINLKALGDYGSIEFRAWRSDGDLAGIAWWCKLLQHLKELSRVVDNPSQIVAEVSNLHPKGFYERILGDFAKDVPWDDEYEPAIVDSVRRVQQYAFQGDW
jgi:hypothetical protein